MKKTINICFGIDNNYVEPLLVTLTSIFENKKKDTKIQIYILYHKLDQKNITNIKENSKKYSYRIKFKKIENLKGFKPIGYLSIASYYRILIPKLFKNINKILYLDCDLIVLSDLYNLYNINLDKKIIGAVEEPHFKKNKIKLKKKKIEDITEQNIKKNKIKNKEIHSNLKIPLKYKIFNTGVLLINSKKYRTENIDKKIIQFLNKNQKILKYCDQDAINAILYKNVKYINLKYNVANSFFNIPNKKEYKKYLIASKNPTIVHFTGSLNHGIFY